MTPMTWITLGAGLVLLLAGGEALVRGSVAVAARLGVSRLLIGLTLVGFGTSTPELMASLQAALAGSPGIALGNVVGSNTANILLMLGISVMILPTVTDRAAFGRDGVVLVGASVLLAALVLWGTIGMAAGLGLLVLLTLYTVLAYRAEARAPAGPAAQVHDDMADAVHPPHWPLWASALLALAGIAGVVAGASFLVGAATTIARAAGLSEAVIGLTLVAVGTSLPELVTGVMAALRRQGDVAFGNVVGSNIFNILGIIGVTATVTPLEVPAQIAGFDIWVMLAATGLLVVFAMTGWRLTRREGAVFLLGYAAYMALLLG
ncbi:calcium/sodium antiporter [Meridianimarinicoccus sp. RP-17]|uniref:calcium/sodium antiporter n=1 Tax=Meridianimarinicoccus zhengii TaxID=2056810 RepID=UPI001F2A3DDC|nr:calcium/sodium antiporter [Phycocomes zhengii]